MVDGCDHEYLRKDMNSHLSGEGLMLHMNLMQQSVVADNVKTIAALKEELSKALQICE